MASSYTNHGDTYTTRQGNKPNPEVKNIHKQRGSGSDKNSEADRLQNPENRLDKASEDSFPASDPPSTSPMTGIGRTSDVPEGIPNDFKDNGAAQFEYGRRSEEATLHFEPNPNRLRRGNPDVGNVDLGNIEADRPAEPDDDDHYD